MILVISTSLHPDSRSRILANYAADYLKSCKDVSGNAIETTVIDLAELPLPFCDGASAYADPAVGKLKEVIAGATGILLAAPVYNYDFGSAAKNLIELTGQAWADKVVGIMCAAGSQVSYMAPMSFANSLMLDFRCLILPRFVFATGDKFEGPSISESEIEDRIKGLVDRLLLISQAIKPPDDAS